MPKTSTETFSSPILDRVWHSSTVFDNGIIFYPSKLVFFTTCYLKNSKSLFMQSSSLYTSCFFFVTSNVHTGAIEYPQNIYSRIYDMNTFSGLFLHSSSFLIKDSQSAKGKCEVLSDFHYWLNSNVFVSLEGITTPEKSFSSDTFLLDLSLSFVLKKWRQFIHVKNPSTLFILIMQIIFLLQNNGILSLSESSQEWLFLKM